MHRMRLKALALAAAFCLTRLSRGAELDSSNLQLSITTGGNQFGFQIVNTASGLPVLSSASTAFGSASVTGASVVSSGNNFVNLNFSLSGGATASGKFSLISPTEVQVNLNGPAGTSAITQMFTDLNQGASQTAENYYGTFSPLYGNMNGLQNNGINAANNTAIADNGTFVSNLGGNGEGARAPFYFTSNNVGVYTPTENIGSYSYAVSGKTGFTFNTTDGTTTNTSLQFNVMVGSSPKDVLSQFRGLAGGAFMPRLSVFDSYFWRDDDHDTVGEAAAGVSNAQGLVLADAQTLATLKIPAGAIQLDRPYGSNDSGQHSDVPGWGDMNFDSTSSGFPTSAAMIAQLKSMGLSTYLWIANRANQNLQTVANANQNFLLPVRTNPAPSPAVSSVAYNLLNPAAYSSFEQQLTALVNQGVTGFKIDRGGEGEMPLAMQNEVPVYFDQLAAQAQAAKNGSFFNIARDPNDQARQYTAVWSGDSTTSFAGLTACVQNGLRAGLIGFPIWGSDTGGYLGTPSEDLWARWIEFSAYNPIMEVALETNGNTARNPWVNYGGGSGALVPILQNQTQVHHDLIPYVQSCLAESLQDGVPIMRAMFLEFPNDPAVANMSTQYMYGPNILVAAVLTASTNGTTNARISTPSSVYLPQGTRWVEYDQTMTVLGNGQQTITTSAPLTAIAGGTTLNLTVAEGTIPTYAREGAIIPRGDIVQDNQSWEANWKPSLHIDFFPSDQMSSFFGYYKSSGTIETIQASITGNILNIDFADLQVAGTMEIYMGRFFAFNGFDAVSMNGQSLDSNAYSYDAAHAILTVPFSGAVDLDVSLTSTPEPGTIGMLAMGMVGLLQKRRRAYPAPARR